MLPHAATLILDLQTTGYEGDAAILECAAQLLDDDFNVISTFTPVQLTPVTPVTAMTRPIYMRHTSSGLIEDARDRAYSHEDLDAELSAWLADHGAVPQGTYAEKIQVVGYRNWYQDTIAAHRLPLSTQLLDPSFIDLVAQQRLLARLIGRTMTIPLHTRSGEVIDACREALIDLHAQTAKGAISS